METTPAQLLRPGQRTLAAIVFTDVVSFSARMQADEDATLRLLNRDFGLMRDMCAQHHGSVLKTTGDGLLLYFPSAVQAVACALAMQRHFANNTKSLPAPEVLVHRVGIHLGDVFVSDQDVMGDGVNIAARLQAEAEPGGICISQTVYDVVKNKLSLHVTSLGPRELKNITESIPIYRLLLEAQAGSAGVEPPAPSSTNSAAPVFPATVSAPAIDPLASARKLWAMKPVRIVAGVCVGAILLLLIINQVRTSAQLRRQEAELAETQAALTKALDEGTVEAEKDAAELTEAAGMRQQMQQLRYQYLDKYNFSGLALALQKQAAQPNAPAAIGALRRSAEQMSVMKEWVITQLQRHNRQNPLVVRELSGSAPKELRVFAGPDRQLYLVEGGAVRGRAWSELPPAALGAIIAATILEGRSAPSAGVVQGAINFARLYNLPALQTTLRAKRPRAAKN
ncbi:MAG TPA: adenylate/guanylate cyclase domain-containing protein [Opitutaceae bacterium]|nr:adenylate/guanylate cyclase domain-containing protein [Opitutaceae bacterium]